MKVSELSGALLDYWVARALGYHYAAAVPYDLCGYWEGGIKDWSPSTDWEQGGPIIEREKIELAFEDEWLAFTKPGSCLQGDIPASTGATPLIAAMRAFVDSKLGALVYDNAAPKAHSITINPCFTYSTGPVKVQVIDYQELLSKYIEHVGAEEGDTFVTRLYPNIDGTFEGYSEKVRFSAGELAALKECEQKYVGPK